MASNRSRRRRNAPVLNISYSIFHQEKDGMLHCIRRVEAQSFALISYTGGTLVAKGYLLGLGHRHNEVMCAKGKFYGISATTRTDCTKHISLTNEI